jgi:hypothetical protein
MRIALVELVGYQPSKGTVKEILLVIFNEDLIDNENIIDNINLLKKEILKLTIEATDEQNRQGQYVLWKNDESKINLFKEEYIVDLTHVNWLKKIKKFFV